jgi:hypothetical protein
MKQYGLAIENWSASRKVDVRKWLLENFGPEDEPKERGRWGCEYDYGLDNLYMDEDVYIVYKLKWAHCD